MPSEFHYVEDTLTQLDALLNTFVLDTATNIIAAFTPLAIQMLIIYMMFWGWAMMRGMIAEPVLDGVNRILRMAFIYGLATSIGLYNSYIVAFFYNAPDALAAVIAGGQVSDNANFLDTSFSSIYDLGAGYIEASAAAGGVIPDMALLVAGWICWLAGTVLIAYGAFLLILAKIAISILLAIGPILLLCLIFESTKNLFNQFLAQLINYVFLVALVSIAIKLILSLLAGYMNAVVSVSPNGSNVEFAYIFPLIFLCAVGVLILVQLPTIAGGLSNGLACLPWGQQIGLIAKQLVK